MGWYPVHSGRVGGGIGVPPSFTQLAIKAISVVLILRDEIWCVAFSEVKCRHSVCTNTERDTLVGYRAATDALKKVAPEVAPEFLK